MVVVGYLEVDGVVVSVVKVVNDCVVEGVFLGGVGFGGFEGGG